MAQTKIDVKRHSASHLLAMAVLDMFPEAKLGIGPSIENGFYYDFLLPRSITPDDLSALEGKIKKLIQVKQKFTKESLNFEQGITLFEKLRQPLKLELIEELKSGARESADEAVTIYKTGDFVDLCAGPHIKDSSEINPAGLKLTKVSGAYWKGDQKREQLQRIYGLYFDTKKELDDYLLIMEEAAKRDHRVLGEKLGLFRFEPSGPGFPFLLPNGTVLYNALVGRVREILNSGEYGTYQEIKTPLILSEQLWKNSGHWAHYKENMYFTEIDSRGYAVKPMNCPGAILIYKSGLYSYRDLPIRLAEFGIVHRHELSGVLSGLFRVRSFTQDDAHVFCTEDQIQFEIENLIKLIIGFYKELGLTDIRMELSTRPEDFMGAQETWDRAEIILQKAMKDQGLDFKINPKDGAFYGPKIDFHSKDVIGRSWQFGTIQLDFQMPEKFDLNYIGEDGKKHRPVMIHRVVLGAVERFMAVIIEHFAGAFPLWLAPVQLKLLPITTDQNEYAQSIRKTLAKAGFRVQADLRSESLGKKIHDGETLKIPYLIIVGKNEVQNETISLRPREGEEIKDLKISDLISKLNEELAK